MGMCGLGSTFDKLSALVIIVPPPQQLNTKICDTHSRLCLAGRVYRQYFGIDFKNNRKPFHWIIKCYIALSHSRTGVVTIIL